MKKACVALLAVLMSCVFIASCQKPAAEETTTSSVSESAQEDDGISAGDRIHDPSVFYDQRHSILRTAVIYL